jgi:hypothetical protein
VSAAGSVPFNDPWKAVVSVREEESLDAELVARFAGQTGQRSVGVTDLISLRRAYFRLLVPDLPIPAARQARMDQGRVVHRDLGTLLSREGTLEARVRRDGLVGRIDILSDLPVEVKTATALVDPAALGTSRPDHVEQLAMYCALVERTVGRLLTLVAEGGSVSQVQAVDIRFQRPGEVLAEMRRRADLLRAAWVAGSVDSLPRCPWYGRGCEFKEAAVCGCTGEEATGAPVILEAAGEFREANDVEERVRALLSRTSGTPAEPVFERFREVLYPRRAYFDRVAVAAPSPPGVPVTPAPLPSLSADLYGRLSEAVESGPAGEVARLVPRSPDPEEEVAGFRGRPLLVRTSRAWERYRPDELVERSPQYALELGLRCAVTGTDSGVVVIGFERAETDRDRIQVLEVRFRSVTPFSRMLRERGRALAEALRDRTPESLHACPAWMVEDCPYRSACGCPFAPPRSTR